MTAMGRQEPPGQLESERQQTEWTGRRLCICQLAAIRLNLPLRMTKARHRRVGQLSAGLPPFGFRPRRAGPDPLLPLRLLKCGRSTFDFGGAGARTAKGIQKRGFSRRSGGMSGWVALAVHVLSASCSWRLLVRHQTTRGASAQITKPTKVITMAASPKWVLGRSLKPFAATTDTAMV